MAARLNNRTAEQSKTHIKTSLLLKRMMEHALSEDGDVMTTSQVNAAKILLGKVLPDHKAIEHEVETEYTVQLVSYKDAPQDKPE